MKAKETDTTKAEHEVRRRGKTAEGAEKALSVDEEQLVTINGA